MNKNIIYLKNSQPKGLRKSFLFLFLIFPSEYKMYIEFTLFLFFKDLKTLITANELKTR